MDVRKERTELRLQLYRNGYTPLANRQKMCLLKGWSTIDVTPDLIQSKAWARNGTFLDTGLRCGDIIALDFDIDDADLLNSFLDEAVEKGVIDESPFVRIGKPPRELWVYRTKDKIGKRTTGHFLPPGDTENHSGYAVEVLGKGCQFAAFGQRDEQHAYHWPDHSPLDHEYMALPEITLQQVEALVALATEFFERNGLERHSPGGGTDHGYTHVYDLEPDMLFEGQEIGQVTAAELTEILLANPDEVIRLKADTFRPTSGSWACMASLAGGVLCVSDHGTYTSHFPVEADVQRAATALGELLAQRMKERAPEPSTEPVPTRAFENLNPRAEFDVNLARALNRYALAVDENLIYDLMRLNAPGQKVDAFRNVMNKYYKSEQGKLGGEKVTRLADMFMQHADRIDVSTAAMRPDMPAPIFEEYGDRHINTYRPPVHNATGGDASIGMAFLDRLLPVPMERKYFLQWLSYKYQNPATRGPAIVMVAQDTYGTGRGSLMQLIMSMFAPGLVNQIDFQTLSGATYQSQYNEWLADNLIVVVNEAQETKQTVSKWQARSNAYERLKEIVEPGTTTTTIMRKGAKNGPARSFCSIMVMTNHLDSVVIPTNDRRLAVLENGTSMPQAYWDLFHAWKSDPANVAAFVRELLKIDISDYSPFAAPPMTAAKADMVEAGTSEIDRLMAEVMSSYSNTLLCREQVVLRFEDMLAEHELDLPDDWRRVVERIFLRGTRKLMGTNDRVKIEGKQRVIRMIGRPEPKTFQTVEAMVQIVTSNGPLTRQVRTNSGSVVAFPQRR